VTAELTLFAGFMMGVLGSVGHCVGMCGGIMGAMTMNVSERRRETLVQIGPFLLAYNLGRIFSYAIAGIIAGLLGSGLFLVIEMETARRISSTIAGLFLLALGLYLAGWWRGLQLVERLGQSIWRRIQPLTRAILPINHPGKAFVSGILWGWLPCGLVYTALAGALAVGDPLQGALLMLSFGLGTLPVMLLVGTASQRLGSLTSHSLVRQIFGSVMIVAGVLVATGLAGLPGHSGHSGHTKQVTDSSRQQVDHSRH